MVFSLICFLYISFLSALFCFTFYHVFNLVDTAAADRPSKGPPAACRAALERTRFF
jgi:hypothetical protein